MTIKNLFGHTVGNDKEVMREYRQNPARIFKFAEVLMAVIEQHIGRRSSVRILDIGCGRGECVRYLRSNGYPNSFGVDFEGPFDEIFSEGQDGGSQGVFRKLETEPYFVPFEDHSFDLIFSRHVVEHVKDHQAFFGEIYRLLKPEGVSFHLFPARFRLLEAHTKIPFGGALTTPLWWNLWAAFGVRPSGQRGVAISEYRNWLDEMRKNRINYLSTVKLRDLLRQWRWSIDYFDCPLRAAYSPNMPSPIFFLLSFTNLIRTFHVRALLLKRTAGP